MSTHSMIIDFEPPQENEDENGKENGDGDEKEKRKKEKKESEDKNEGDDSEELKENIKSILHLQNIDEKVEKVQSFIADASSEVFDKVRDNPLTENKNIISTGSITSKKSKGSSTDSKRNKEAPDVKEMENKNVSVDSVTSKKSKSSSKHSKHNVEAAGTTEKESQNVSTGSVTSKKSKNSLKGSEHNVEAADITEEENQNVSTGSVSSKKSENSSKGFEHNVEAPDTTEKGNQDVLHTGSKTSKKSNRSSSGSERSIKTVISNKTQGNDSALNEDDKTADSSKKNQMAIVQRNSLIVDTINTRRLFGDRCVCSSPEIEPCFICYMKNKACHCHPDVQYQDERENFVYIFCSFIFMIYSIIL